MNAVKGTVQNGQVALDNPTDLPEGSRVLIEPITEEETFGVREEDWQDTPEAVAAWLRWYDSLEPIERSAQEEGEWQAARAPPKRSERRPLSVNGPSNCGGYGSEALPSGHGHHERLH